MKLILLQYLEVLKEGYSIDIYHHETETDSPSYVADKLTDEIKTKYARVLNAEIVGIHKGDCTIKNCPPRELNNFLWELAGYGGN